MLYFSRWTLIATILISTGSLLFTAPNLISQATYDKLPGWMQLPRMPLGLDLRGGTHLLYQLDTAELRKEWIENIVVEARSALREEKIAHLGIRGGGNQVRVTIREAEKTDAALRRLQQLAQPLAGSLLGGASGTDITVARGEGNTITLQPSEAGLQERLTSAVARTIETLRRRIDPTGTTEAVIQRQGQDRVLIQVPGREPAEVKELVGKPARLTFHLVDESMSANEAAAGRAPLDSFVAASAENPGQNFLVAKEVIVTGDDLVDAQLGFHPDTNEPVVNFRFGGNGSRKFGKVTSDNRGRLLAIVLDNEVVSAPQIRNAILGGTGYIEGNFTQESATQLATLLRSGALPASLTIVEERSVGPSLGADSIEAGKLAGIIGFVAVSVFMIACYGLFGFFALIGLAINIFLIIAALSLLGATLTLPGIAGIVLTMGLSVDANVLINERIRDEVRAGRSPIKAIENGFSTAYGTIFDTNMTGLVTSIILYFLGSGPVRGFAVTLGIGILASAFTATTITRLLAVQWLKATKPQTVPI
jgi:protein-export membrane protein SecD